MVKSKSLLTLESSHNSKGLLDNGRSEFSLEKLLGAYINISSHQVKSFSSSKFLNLMSKYPQVDINYLIIALI